MENDIKIYRRKMNCAGLKCMEILQTRTMADSSFVFYNLGFISGGVCNLFTSIHQVYPSIGRNVGRHATIKLAISRRITLHLPLHYFISEGLRVAPSDATASKLFIQASVPSHT